MRLEVLENDNLALKQNAEIYKLQMQDAKHETQVQSSASSNLREELENLRVEYFAFKKANISADTKIQELKGKL